MAVPKENQPSNTERGLPPSTVHDVGPVLNGIRVLDPFTRYFPDGIQDQENIGRSVPEYGMPRGKCHGTPTGSWRKLNPW